MKKGFSIEIQLDLTEEEKKVAEEYACEFIGYAVKHNMEYPLKGAGGWRSFVKRGIFGYVINDGHDDQEESLVFRRISRNQRRFGIVKTDTLLCKETNQPVNIRQCRCSKCRGGTKVIWKYKPETYTYAVIGDIKG